MSQHSLEKIWSGFPGDPGVSHADFVIGFCFSSVALCPWVQFHREGWCGQEGTQDTSELSSQESLLGMPVRGQQMDRAQGQLSQEVRLIINTEPWSCSMRQNA